MRLVMVSHRAASGPKRMPWWALVLIALVLAGQIVFTQPWVNLRVAVATDDTVIPAAKMPIDPLRGLPCPSPPQPVVGQSVVWIARTKQATPKQSSWIKISRYADQNQWSANVDTDLIHGVYAVRYLDDPRCYRESFDPDGTQIGIDLTDKGVIVWVYVLKTNQV